MASAELAASRSLAKFLANAVAWAIAVLCAASAGKHLPSWPLYTLRLCCADWLPANLLLDRMALKSTVYKAHVQIADMDRSLYADHSLTLARHPSETDERLMMRVLSFALAVPADDLNGRLESAAGLSDTDEPDLWQKDLTGQIIQWIEMGQPDDRRLAKACGRAEVVRIWAYGSSTPIWWNGLENKVARLSNLEVWQVPAETSRELSALAQRSMQLQVTVQEGHIWVGNGEASVEVAPVALKSLASR